MARDGTFFRLGSVYVFESFETTRYRSRNKRDIGVKRNIAGLRCLGFGCEKMRVFEVDEVLMVFL